MHLWKLQSAFTVIRTAEFNHIKNIKLNLFGTYLCVFCLTLYKTVKKENATSNCNGNK